MSLMKGLWIFITTKLVKNISVNGKFQLKYVTQTVIIMQTHYGIKVILKCLCTYARLTKYLEFCINLAGNMFLANWFTLITRTLECTIHQLSFMCRSQSLWSICVMEYWDKMKNLIHPPKPLPFTHIGTLYSIAPSIVAWIA